MAQLNQGNESDSDDSANAELAFFGPPTNSEINDSDDGVSQILDDDQSEVPSLTKSLKSIYGSVFLEDAEELQNVDVLEDELDCNEYKYDPNPITEGNDFKVEKVHIYFYLFIFVFIFYSSNL